MSRRVLCSVAVLGVLLGSSACGGSQAPAKPKTSASASPTTQLPPDQDIVAAGATALDVPDADWVQVVGGSAWTALGADGSVVRLAAGTGKQDARVDTGTAGVCTAMDQGFGSLWVGLCSEPPRLLRVDPKSGRALATIRLPATALVAEGAIAAGEGAVWLVVEAPDNHVVKVDPVTNSVTGSVPVPAGVVGVRAGLGGLWLTNPEGGTVLRLDPATGQAVATIPVGAGPRFFAVGDDAVWVQNNSDGSVSRIDPKTNKVVARIHVDGRVDGGDLAVGGGFVWARISGALVAKIDPTTNAVVARYGPAGGSGSVAADDDALWVTAHDQNIVYRLPLR
jgi:streptogramin lyase